MNKGARQKKRYCSRWGGLNEVEFEARTSTIKTRLMKIRRFVRSGLKQPMYQAENVVSIGHELDHDHLTLVHIRSEFDWLIGELTVERAKVEGAISRVNAGVG
jgi:hypothetical protein